MKENGRVQLHVFRIHTAGTLLQIESIMQGDDGICDMIYG